MEKNETIGRLPKFGVGDKINLQINGMFCKFKGGNIMLNIAKRLWREEEGQGMVEYGLILALVSIAVILALTGIGTQLNTKFNEVLTKLGGTPA